MSFLFEVQGKICKNLSALLQIYKNRKTVARRHVVGHRTVTARFLYDNLGDKFQTSIVGRPQGVMSSRLHLSRSLYDFLAHLSRRLIGELIVYPCSGVRPSVVRPSSTISKIFFSETAGPIVLILHIHHLQVGGNNNCVFCFDRIRTLVAMATYASLRLIMEKSENCQFLLSCWRYLNFVFAEMFIE